MVTGITALRMRVLIKIGQRTNREDPDSEVSVKHLAFDLGKTDSVISKTVDDLVQGGFARRRMSNVRLINKGFQVFDACAAGLGMQVPEISKAIRPISKILRGEP